MAIALKRDNPAAYGLVRTFCIQQVAAAEGLVRQKEAECEALRRQGRIPDWGNCPRVWQLGAEDAQEVNGRVVMLLVRAELKARDEEAFGLPVWRWTCQFVFDGKATPTGADRLWLFSQSEEELERIAPLYELFTGGQKLPPTPTPRPTATPRPTVTPTRTPTPRPAK